MIYSKVRVLAGNMSRSEGNNEKYRARVMFQIVVWLCFPFLPPLYRGPVSTLSLRLLQEAGLSSFRGPNSRR